MDSVQRITARDNPLLKLIRKLAADNRAYRKLGKIWLEGDHLLQAALNKGVHGTLVVSDAFRGFDHTGYPQAAIKIIAVSNDLFAGLSGLEEPSQVGFLVDLPAQPALTADASTLILDRVQDAGNVGSMLRSAAAFGFTQVIALKGTAALWSPKVLRAGMGAHFGLALIEGVEPDQLRKLSTPILVTSSHQGEWLGRSDLPTPCSWAMGHEGQGVGAEVAALAHRWIRIRQPGGEESLNVASAAAICMHESVRLSVASNLPAR